MPWLSTENFSQIKQWLGAEFNNLIFKMLSMVAILDVITSSFELIWAYTMTWWCSTHQFSLIERVTSGLKKSMFKIATIMVILDFLVSTFHKIWTTWVTWYSAHNFSKICFRKQTKKYFINGGHIEWYDVTIILNLNLQDGIMFKTKPQLAMTNNSIHRFKENPRWPWWQPYWVPWPCYALNLTLFNDLFHKSYNLLW